MNTTTAYTPLESLLLFQSLAISGTDPDVFIRTSTLLKANILIRDGETYDPGRLSPDALRELYLQLLREELRLEASNGEGKGDTGPTKKRKLQSPLIPTIKDANQYSDKLPQLVDRLYARYRDYMIIAIREDERKYETLQREIAEIEQGEWDERIVMEEPARSKRTPSVAAEETKAIKPAEDLPAPIAAAAQDGQERENVRTVLEVKDGGKSQTDLSPPPEPALPKESKTEGLAINDVLNSRESSPPKASEPTVVSQPENGVPILPPLGHQKTISQDRLHGPSPLQPIQQRPWEQYQGAQSPLQPPPYLPNTSHPQFLPQYPPYPAGPQRGTFSVPPSHSHVPSSPLNNNYPPILPPPNIGRGSGSPTAGPLDQLADLAGQQYRAPSTTPLLPQGAALPQYGPPYPAYPPQHKNDGRPPTGNGTPQWNLQYASGYPPPSNYNYPPQPSANQRPFSNTPSAVQLEQRHYYSPYNPSLGPRPVNSSSASTPRPLHLRDVSLPQTPVPFGMTPNSTGRATKWTPNPTSSTPRVPKSPRQPKFEPLSPVIPAAGLPPANLPPVKGAKTPKNNAKARKAEAPTTEKPVKAKRGIKRAKPGSPASPAVGSLRSQSVMSHADELSLVTDATSVAAVKQEAATPIGVDDIGEATAEETTKRPRGGPMRPSPRRFLKRKRHDSPPREPSGPPTHVLWTRNFPRISASALERIGAHRSASTFAQAIKERDAPGYANVILRPQDLKSIRAAINSGYKAGLAIASTMGDQGQASMLIPISADLIPPKGIVNNAQLEKELMRIFANAIMFNHDPNRKFGKGFEVAQSIEESAGTENYDVDENQLVNDTRAMFADVDKIVEEMRSAEWRKEGAGAGEVVEDDVDELAGEVESSVTTSTAKRRRRA